MIDVKIILDSIDTYGNRLITVVCTYPRFILAEVNTHRMFSRNSASSRAKPVSKMRRMILDNPVVPFYWGANQRGMSASEELTGWKLWLAKKIWLALRYPAITASWIFEKIGLHKQIANRILEPWLWTQTIITATDWVNFLTLRNNEMAQPEIQALAQAIETAISNSTPVTRKVHIPFILPEEEQLPEEDRLGISVARCARVSYYLHDGRKPSLDKDLGLFKRLLTHGHWSPFEHQAFLQDEDIYFANFRGWQQFRKLQKNENYDIIYSLPEYFEVPKS